MSSIAKKFQQLSFILNRFTGLVTELNKRYFWVVSKNYQELAHIASYLDVAAVIE